MIKENYIMIPILINFRMYRISITRKFYSFNFNILESRHNKRFLTDQLDLIPSECLSMIIHHSFVDCRCRSMSRRTVASMVTASQQAIPQQRETLRWVAFPL